MATADIKVVIVDNDETESWRKDELMCSTISRKNRDGRRYAIQPGEKITVKLDDTVQTVKLEMVDGSLYKNYHKKDLYRDAQIFLLYFSCEHPQPFLEIQSELLPLINKYARSDSCTKVLVGFDCNEHDASSDIWIKAEAFAKENELELVNFSSFRSDYRKVREFIVTDYLLKNKSRNKFYSLEAVKKALWTFLRIFVTAVVGVSDVITDWLMILQWISEGHLWWPSILSVSVAFPGIQTWRLFWKWRRVRSSLHNKKVTIFKFISFFLFISGVGSFFCAVILVSWYFFTYRSTTLKSLLQEDGFGVDDESSDNWDVENQLSGIKNEDPINQKGTGVKSFDPSSGKEIVIQPVNDETAAEDEEVSRIKDEIHIFQRMKMWEACLEGVPSTLLTAYMIVCGMYKERGVGEVRLLILLTYSSCVISFGWYVVFEHKECGKFFGKCKVFWIFVGTVSEVHLRSTVLALITIYCRIQYSLLVYAGAWLLAFVMHIDCQIEYFQMRRTSKMENHFWNLLCKPKHLFKLMTYVFPYMISEICVPLLNISDSSSFHGGLLSYGRLGAWRFRGCVINFIHVSTAFFLMYSQKFEISGISNPLLNYSVFIAFMMQMILYVFVPYEGKICLNSQTFCRGSKSSFSYNYTSDLLVKRDTREGDHGLQIQFSSFSDRKAVDGVNVLINDNYDGSLRL